MPTASQLKNSLPGTATTQTKEVASYNTGFWTKAEGWCWLYKYGIHLTPGLAEVSSTLRS